MEYSPCMSGTIFQAPNPPVPMNCPTNTSIAKAGIPTKMTVMKYGTRNAPVTIELFVLLLLCILSHAPDLFFQIEKICELAIGRLQRAH